MKKQDRVWIILLCAFTTFVFMCMTVVYVSFEKPSVAKARTYKEKYASCQNDNQQLRQQIAQMEQVKPLWLERDAGLQIPFRDFITSINAEVAGLDSTQQNTIRDPKFYGATLTYLEKLRQYRGFWQNLKQVKDNYSYVISEMRQANLPEVFAAIPYQETHYNSTLQSVACAKGLWQFQPETAHRLGLEVKNCTYKNDAESTFAPTELAPPLLHQSEYIEKNQNGDYSCKIDTCEVDERLNLQKSTKAAISYLNEIWSDEELKKSGALVQLAILSYNAGYNDEPYLKKKKMSNILPAFKQYLKKTNTNGATFYGDNLTCDSKTDLLTNPGERCGGVLANQTQHYAYKIVAQHMLAVCFYAKNYPEDPNFSTWTKYTDSNSYCSQMEIPSLEEL